MFTFYAQLRSSQSLQSNRQWQPNLPTITTYLTSPRLPAYFAALGIPYDDGSDWVSGITITRPDGTTYQPYANLPGPVVPTGDFSGPRAVCHANWRRWLVESLNPGTDSCAHSRPNPDHPGRSVGWVYHSRNGRWLALSIKPGRRTGCDTSGSSPVDGWLVESPHTGRDSRYAHTGSPRVIGP